MEKRDALNDRAAKEERVPCIQAMHLPNKHTDPETLRTQLHALSESVYLHCRLSTGFGPGLRLNRWMMIK
jgi:hypothetical protein